MTGPPTERTGPHQGRPATYTAEPMIAVDAALRYAARGWRVFPCRPGSKAPATVNGFKNGTTDAAVIRAWWSAVPSANVAIVTGSPGPDVLDVDVKPAGTGWPALNRVKRAGLLAGALALVRTRNGGMHLYFAGSDQTSGRLPRHHLDFKAAGGYVLAPPSLVPADDWANGGPGGYVLLEERAGTGRLDWAAVVRLLDPLSPVAPRRTWPGGRDVGRLAAWLARQQEGNRNEALYWAAVEAVKAGLGEHLDELVAAATDAGLDEREARRTVASALRRFGGAR